MKITTKQLKQIIKEELNAYLNESLLVWVREQPGVDFDVIQNIMLLPNGMDFLNMLRQKKFKSIGDGKWQTKFNYKDSKGVQSGNPTTATLHIEIPDGGLEQPTIHYHGTQERGYLKDNPYEETFVGFDKLMDFLDLLPSDWAGEQAIAQMPGWKTTYGKRKYGRHG